MKKRIFFWRCRLLICVVCTFSYNVFVVGCHSGSRTLLPADHLIIPLSQADYVRVRSDYEGASESGFEVPLTELFDPAGQLRYVGPRADIDNLLQNISIAPKDEGAMNVYRGRSLDKFLGALHRNTPNKATPSGGRWTAVSAISDVCESCFTYESTFKQQHLSGSQQANILELRIIASP